MQTTAIVLDDLTTAFRISPRYFITNYGMILPVNFLMYVKKKSKEEAMHYIKSALGKLTTERLEEVIAATEQHAPYPDWLAFTDSSQLLQNIKVALTQDSLRYAFFKDPTAQPIINITVIQDSTVNIHNNPEPTASFAPAPKKTPKVRKLNYRLINDDALTFQDRIIFSLAWKWHWLNERRQLKEKSIRRVTVEQFRRATGFRPRTIQDSLTRLMSLNYLSPVLAPITTNSAYRKLTWTKSGNGIAFDIFDAMVRTNTKYTNAGWFVKSLGISKRTYYRMKDRQNDHITDDTQKRNG